MLREFARAGHGFAPVPSVLEAQFRRESGFVRHGTRRKGGVLRDIGRAEYTTPAIAVMTGNARRLLSQS